VRRSAVRLADGGRSSCHWRDRRFPEDELHEIIPLAGSEVDTTVEKYGPSVIVCGVPLASVQETVIVQLLLLCGPFTRLRSKTITVKVKFS
jgi:hypothetical protein